MAQLRFHPAHLPGSLAGVDLAFAARRISDIVFQNGAKSVTIAPELALRSKRGGAAVIASFAVETDQLRRIFVAHLRVSPAFEMLTLAARPRGEFAAPLLLADLRIVPPGRLAASLVAIGPPADHAYAATAQQELERVIEVSPPAIERIALPTWAMRESPYVGASLRTKRAHHTTLVDTALAFVAAHARLSTAAPAADAPKTDAMCARVFRGMRDESRAFSHLADFFGAEWAARFMRALAGEGDDVS